MPLPPAAEELPKQRWTAIKSKSMTTGRNYRTRASSAELRAFFAGALSAKGCEPRADLPLRDWGRDLRGWSLLYGCPTHEVSLQYAGAKSDYGWDLAIALKRE